jgi:hypothetical protein
MKKITTLFILMVLLSINALNAQITVFTENFSGFTRTDVSANNRAKIMKTNGVTAMSGWIICSGARQEAGALKLGQGSTIGYVTTPKLDLSGGTITVSFNAAQYVRPALTPPATYKVAVLVDGAKVGEVTVGMAWRDVNTTNPFNSYSVSGISAASSNSRITLEVGNTANGGTAGNSIILDQVEVAVNGTSVLVETLNNFTLGYSWTWNQTWDGAATYTSNSPTDLFPFIIGELNTELDTRTQATGWKGKAIFEKGGMAVIGWERQYNAASVSYPDYPGYLTTPTINYQTGDVLTYTVGTNVGLVGTPSAPTMQVLLGDINSPTVISTPSLASSSTTTAGTTYTYTFTSSGSSPITFKLGGTVTKDEAFLSLVKIDRTSVFVSSNANISSISASSAIDVTVSSGLLTVDDNASVKSLTVNPGAKLTLAAGKTLTVVGTTTLKIDATGTATLIDSYESPTVNATVQQYLPQGRNWYVASPIESTIAPASATGLTVSGAAASVSYYDETQNGTPNAWVNNYTGNILRGIGYVAVSNSGTGTNNIELSGTLNSGNVPVTLTRTGTGGFAGYNLIANPYPSYINPMSAINSLNVEKTIWYRTKGSTYKFETVNTTTGVGTDAALSGNAVTGYIPPLQAFWVRTNVNNVQLMFTNSMRTHANPVVGETTINTTALKAPKQQTNSIARININGSAGNDQAVLYFNASASNGFDDFDSRKMLESISATTPEIYLLAEAEKVAINGMQSIPYDTEIPLGFIVKQTGDFSISRSEFSNFESGTRILLKDKLYPTTEFELTEGASYNFSSQPTAAITDRFSLVFRAPGVTTAIDNASKLNTQVFVNAANQITIIAPEKSSYVIYNAVGQLSAEGTINQSPFTINHSKGVYVVKVGNTNSTRVIIK